ncbi:hypothetical protein AB205_0129350 [Aquarana catesbeiana]|uniref:Branched-chain-amino-acid aminotransferase n=1 Tax=Aquarana catesbeiana TaxID=8400 RepID=A0A2G9RA85_AQUCT|nr:hypothetical protein AB205_0129350 [Aquarana catesbeiana]
MDLNRGPDSRPGINYGPTIYVQSEASQLGCQQVLWLYGDNHEVTEAGTMNFFMFWTNEQGEKELITPPLSGLILPGITRQSLLDLARQWGEFKVSESTVTMNDLIKGLRENRVYEVFGAGTACVVCPVSRILYNDKSYHIPTMENGPEIAKRFLKELTDIQPKKSQQQSMAELPVNGHSWYECKVTRVRISIPKYHNQQSLGFY